MAPFDRGQAYTGQYADGENGISINFRTVETEGGLSFEIAVNEKIFTFDLSQEDGLRNFDGNGSTLSAEEREALKRMSRHRAENDVQNYENQVQVVATYTGADYLSQVPDGHVINSRTFEPSLGLKNEGVTCIKKGTIVRAEWRDRYKTVRSENVLVGANWPNNYGCMGRCGADCGWGAPSSWTKDCMDHDVCSYRHKASGGSSDPNCGETYDQAADDWFWGVGKGCFG